MNEDKLYLSDKELNQIGEPQDFNEDNSKHESEEVLKACREGRYLIDEETENEQDPHKPEEKEFDLANYEDFETKPKWVKARRLTEELII